MTSRKSPIVTNEIYHIYNRSVAQQPIFRNVRENNIFTELINYYRFSNTPLRFSYYSRLTENERINILDSIFRANKTRIEIYSFSLMTNHYHILARQTTENGISNFIRHVQDSYAKYLNKKMERSGALFQSPFKAVRIETDEQFIHVARYIHLNPLTSYVLRDTKELYTFPWNSWVDYVGYKPRAFVKTDVLLSFVGKNKIEDFTFNQLDYQRQLESIKHLIIE